MSAGGFAGRVVATAVVATDGSGDFTDIQTAIDSLPSTGGVVFVKEGLYQIDNSLQFPFDNISLVGTGRSTTIEQTETTSNLIFIEKNGIRIQDLRLLHTGVVSANNIAISMAIGTTNFKIINNWIENVAGGILAGSNGLILGNDIEDTNVLAIQLADSEDVVVANNIINNSQGTGNGAIDMIRSDNCILANNKLDNHDANKKGIWLDDSDRNLIVGNMIQVISGTGDGIFIEADCNNNLVSSNISDQISDSGVATEIGHNMTG